MAPLAKPRSLGIPPVLPGGRFENGEVIYQDDFPYNSAAVFEASLGGWL
ncbi:MAG: hypothetical protein H0T56_10040, partial [Pseudaminobacter sp.]|nr:hypothetical protein [Pseudaminobacter sp.]